MSMLDTSFTLCKKITKNPPKPPTFFLGFLMNATLTGTKPAWSYVKGSTKPGYYPAFVATASGAKLTYKSGPPAKMSFDATLKFQLSPSAKKKVPVTLTQNTGGGYSMKIVLPWKTVNCVANVDASGVVYGSQGNQFVTLVPHAYGVFESPA